MVKLYSIKRAQRLALGLGVCLLFLYLLFFRRSGPVPLRGRDADWALRVHDHQHSVYSQGKQDGALQYIFHHIGATNRLFVEFGFSNPTMEGGTGPNTRLLWEQGWKGWLFDGTYENPDIRLAKLWILPETIVGELWQRGVPNGTDYISIDIDSADCFVMEKVACEMQPRVLTVEYNCNYPLEATIANIGKEYRWSGADRAYGCGLGVHSLIAKKCGYVIVDVVRCLDVVLVRADLAGDTAVYPLEHWRPMTTIPFHPNRHEETTYDRFLCEYPMYMRTGRLADCVGAPARQQLAALNYHFTDGWYKFW